jgi:hypothetical protein
MHSDGFETTVRPPNGHIPFNERPGKADLAASQL